MKSNINTQICQGNTWARLINGRGMRRKRYLSCAVVSLINMVTALIKKVRGSK